MNHNAFHFAVQPLEPWREILIAELSELGFLSFLETETGFTAFAEENRFDKAMLAPIKETYSLLCEVSFEIGVITEQNWNAVWESNFSPVEVEEKCRVRAPFHLEKTGFQYELVIQPKMSFGTGHHATTWLMIREMFNLEIEGKAVLDMGAGTGILGILAAKMGANAVHCIDIEDWSYENMQENIAVNNTPHVTVDKGGAELLLGKSYNIIFANINKNVLLEDITTYSKALTSGGDLLLSGFFPTDTESFTGPAEKIGLIIADRREKDNWALLRLVKK